MQMESIVHKHALGLLNLVAHHLSYSIKEIQSVY